MSILYISLNFLIFLVDKDYYGTDYDMFKKSKITIDSGVTVLVGCNGAGKTTLLVDFHLR